VPAVESILLVPIEYGNIYRCYTRAVRDQDLEIFSLHTQALNYTPNTMPTEQMIDELCIPHLLHMLPKLRSLVLRHESYWGPWIKQILTNWHMSPQLWKNNPLRALTRLDISCVAEDQFFDISSTFPILNAAASTLQHFTGRLVCSENSLPSSDDTSFPVLPNLVQMIFNQSSIKMKWWELILSRTPQLRRLVYTRDTYSYIIERKRFFQSLWKLRGTLESLELTLAGDQLDLADIDWEVDNGWDEMLRPLGPLCEFRQLQYLRIEFGMLVGSKEMGGPAVKLVDVLPDSLRWLALTNFVHPLIAYLSQLYDVVRARRLGRFPMLRAVENCEQSDYVFHPQPTMEIALRLKAACAKFGVMLAGRDPYGYLVSKDYMMDGVYRTSTGNVTILQLWEELIGEVSDDSDWNTSLFDSSEEEDDSEDEDE